MNARNRKSEPEVDLAGSGRCQPPCCHVSQRHHGSGSKLSAQATAEGTAQRTTAMIAIWCCKDERACSCPCL
ncbi:hypothetical protein DPMN_117749 [Dreissena polymorpha]|uniref:Uncharacterized protein n=1 Tax=Dreissena polymorpha TaxID=45954 RepID=A0A9D4GIT9_DREPO|nr:hypothetical protein DPMN_117749 [Dreissena polymorpha]